MVVSSANFRCVTEGSLAVQSFVYREKSSREITHPQAVLIVRMLDVNFPILTCCRSAVMIVLKVDLKSTNWILA